MSTKNKTGCLVETAAEAEASRARPAHRPSRRKDLIQAAIVVFARKGYAESSVEDVASEASVVPTAIYYHFGSKDELLYQALKAAMDQFSDHVLGVRTEGQQADADAMRRVIAALWQWWETHPYESMLIGRYSNSTTGQARELRSEWEERHRGRAYGYIADGAAGTRPGRVAREEHAVTTLRLRALLDVVLASQAAALPGGTLAGSSSDALAAELAEVCVRIVAAP